jgi:hypothetical protein
MTGQILHSLWVASAVSVLIAQPLRAEVVHGQPMKFKQAICKV